MATNLRTAPKRGEIWMVEFDPTRGHEQSGLRPALIVSTNLFNASPAELVIALPITSTDRQVRSHVALDAPEGGVKRRSFIMCEAVRSISTERLGKCWGTVSAATLEAVEMRLRVLFDL